MPTLTRAPACTAGTCFLAGPIPEDHECRATCYRVTGNGRDERISTMCDYGHGVTMRYTRRDGGIAGSAFAASLNDLPVYAPFTAGA